MDSHTDQPTLAAIVANWNGEAFIERCLGSLLAAARRTQRRLKSSFMTMPARTARPT